jgi:hypothetical protein
VDRDELTLAIEKQIMKLLSAILFATMAAATPVLEKHPRGPAELSRLDVRSADCAYITCNGGCGRCSDGHNVCCPYDLNLHCFTFRC